MTTQPASLTSLPTTQSLCKNILQTVFAHKYFAYFALFLHKIILQTVIAHKYLVYFALFLHKIILQTVFARTYFAYFAVFAQNYFANFFCTQIFCITVSAHKYFAYFALFLNKNISQTVFGGFFVLKMDTCTVCTQGGKVAVF